MTPASRCNSVNSRDIRFTFSGERFPIELIGSYDIDRAKGILAKSPRISRPVRVAPWSALAAEMEWNTLAPTADSPVDCSMPVILATVDEAHDEYMLIDGWHRLEKAIATGHEFVPGFYLTQQESKEIFDLAWSGAPLSIH